MGFWNKLSSVDVADLADERIEQSAPAQRPKIGTSSNPLVVRTLDIGQFCFLANCDGLLCCIEDSLYICDMCGYHFKQTQPIFLKTNVIKAAYACE